MKTNKLRFFFQILCSFLVWSRKFFGFLAVFSDVGQKSSTKMTDFGPQKLKMLSLKMISRLLKKDFKKDSEFEFLNEKDF